ncbi:MAG: M23 family metallopeptidase [Paracoccaceae bacterium]
MIRAIALLILALAVPAGAFELAPFKLTWPADCILGDTCHIQQYFDRDPGPAATDFTCGTLSYDGHDGTDIALISRTEMAEGIAVLSAAPGVVKGVRDGVQDFVPNVAGKECGNGVVIDHADGWQTQYCHMRDGSVLVKPGDLVVTGTKLGLIGQSGMADFPHLHLSVRHNGTKIDPFEPDPTATCNATPGTQLWANPVAYEPGGFLSAGFTTAVPKFDAIRAGLPTNPLARDAPGLALWAYVFGSHAGDELQFTIIGPIGEVLKTTTTLEKTQAQLFRANGIRVPEGGWPDGTYNGTIAMMRAGTKIDEITTKVQVGP